MNSQFNMSRNLGLNAMHVENVKQTNPRRFGEDGQAPPRRKRIYTDGKNWFFLTRNNGNHGPYKTFTEAKSALKLFMRRSGIVNFNDDPGNL
jgi:hypothetical protein